VAFNSLQKKHKIIDDKCSISSWFSSAENVKYISVGKTVYNPSSAQHTWNSNFSDVTKAKLLPNITTVTGNKSASNQQTG